VFERSVLALLREVDVRDVVGGHEGPDDVLAIAGERAGVEAKIAEIERELLNGDVAALAKVLRQLEERKRELVAAEAEARQRAATPLDDTWEHTHSLLAALDDASDQEEARGRLRSVLNRVISEVRVLVVTRGRDRLAVAQVWFAGGDRHREY